VSDDAGIIPHLPGALREIAEVAGVEAALAIARRFPGCRLEIPVCRDLLAEVRNRQIRADYDAGESVNGLAVRYRLTSRHICTILGKPDSDIAPPVLPLFRDF